MYFSEIKAMVHPVPTTKFLSTKGGRVVITCIEDVMIYARTQGIFYWRYNQGDRITEYMLLLAELMLRESRHKFANLCFRHAHYHAWRSYINHKTTERGDGSEAPYDPYEIYNTARLHLLTLRDQDRNLKLFREQHQKFRHIAYLERTLPRVVFELDFKRHLSEIIGAD